MRKRGFGVLFVLTLVIGAGTLFQDFRFDALLEHERDTAASVDRQLGSIDVAIADLHGAQAGYVAAGQGPAFWIARATDLFTRIDTDLTSLRSATASTDAATHYDAALVALRDLKGIDARARSDAMGDRRFEAADRVFTDSREANERLAAELGAARTSEQAAAAANLTRVSKLRLILNGVAMVFLLAVAAFFWRARPVESAAADAGITSIRPDLPLRLNVPATPAAPSAPPPPAQAAVTKAAPAVSAAVRRDVDLRDAAELCVDLARVIDGRDMQALLQRAAAVLDAKGVILWMTDSAGAQLRPQLAHGYSDRVLAKMGTLQVDGDNVTSLAFRSVREQTVNGATSSSAGAIAVPLVTSSGCIGVLAAEVNRQRPTADTVDMARIIAAQFATLVVPSGETSRAAQG
jgi:hypothetical protein